MEVIQTMGSLVLSFGVFDGPNAIKCNIYIYILHIYIYIYTHNVDYSPPIQCLFYCRSGFRCIRGTSSQSYILVFYMTKSPGHQISCQSSSSLFWVQRCLLSFVNSQSNPPFSPESQFLLICVQPLITSCPDELHLSSYDQYSASFKFLHCLNSPTLYKLVHQPALVIG